jgi:hypothetical protein
MNAIHQLLAYESTLSLSIEEAKTRLADYNILLKYISFLQKKVVF